ncbi:MAG: glycosyltransferase family 4 protein [Ignavibacteriales bacterium]|nr:glycosyltransferase family 4 protein [Ignavibacteriales bacterium]MCF8305681.1 glycosyltransferase family 4 protein [Ignavibacteriales bacterium]MCF8315403.1 glycosyltransferase family 4 protein [Ignavibacteriales bacterium]MCF8436705.1 glycosyltransferase family 4 protein [Ignavibacteriales bacterium]
MKTTLMLLQAPFPPDIRLEKEITSLNRNDFRVVLLCNNYGNVKKKHFSGVIIERLWAPFRNIRLNQIMNFPVFFNPHFILRAVWLVIKYRPDFIHAHDLPMMPLGVILKILTGKPLIFDMHENYPEALRYFNKKGMLNKIFKNPALAALLEKFSIIFADIIISVVSENTERLKAQGVAPDTLREVSNTVDLETFIVGGETAGIKEFEGKQIIIYSGTVGYERGLEIPVEAMKYLRRSFPNAALAIVGEGTAIPFLKETAVQHGVQDMVMFLAWPGHDQIGKYISTAEICIISQPSNPFINTTIPHKLFEYMAAGKPIIVSDAKPLKRIIEETGAGEFFVSGDAKSFALAASEMLQSTSKYGDKGLAAVRSKYNWKNDEAELLAIYTQLSESVK